MKKRPHPATTTTTMSTIQPSSRKLVSGGGLRVLLGALGFVCVSFQIALFEGHGDIGGAPLDPSSSIGKCHMAAKETTRNNQRILQSPPTSKTILSQDDDDDHSHNHNNDDNDSLLVTILVDDLGSCPEKCNFFHSLLPKWVKFQYLQFENSHRQHTSVVAAAASGGNNNTMQQHDFQVGDRVVFQDLKYREWWNGAVANYTIDDTASLEILKDEETTTRRVALSRICKVSGEPCRQAPYHKALHQAAQEATRKFQNLHTGSKNQRLHHHILIVTRKGLEEIAQWAKWYKNQQNSHDDRQQFTTSVGLFLMADEKLKRHRHLHHSRLYQNFDYILRNYWFSRSQFPFPLQALGNQTCGTRTIDVASSSTSMDQQPPPKHGIHWVPLQPHEHNALLQRDSAWPTAFRSKNCSFTGWKGIGPGAKARSSLLQTSSLSQYSALQCDVKLQKGFNGGAADPKQPKDAKATSKFYYLTGLSDSKIGFNPRGVHPECHRLPELLISGTVPAMTHEEYMDYVPVRRIPGIVGEDWKQVMDQVQGYLSSEQGMQKLDSIAKDGIKWWNEVQGCMRSDMGKILAQVMNDYNDGEVSIQLQ